MDVVAVFPHVARNAGEIVFTSRIRFRMRPASADLAHRLLSSGQMQVLFYHPESPERLVVWPLSIDTAIMEMTHRGPDAEGVQLRFAHEMHAKAQVCVLSEVAGFAEIVHPIDFDKTNPLSEDHHNILETSSRRLQWPKGYLYNEKAPRR